MIKTLKNELMDAIKIHLGLCKEHMRIGDYGAAYNDLIYITLYIQDLQDILLDLINPEGD